MSLLSGPLHIVCVVLAVAGLAKVRSPGPARRAVAALGVVVPAWAIRALGAAEIALATATIALGGVALPIAVALVHLAFIGVLIRLGHDSAVSCGCFGSADTPPSSIHIMANILSAGTAVAAIGVDGLPAALDAQPTAGLLQIGLVVIGAAATVLILTVLPKLTAGPVVRPNEFALVARS